MYERLIREVKKTLYKTLGTTYLTFEQLESVVIDIKKTSQQPATNVCREQRRGAGNINAKRDHVGTKCIRVCRHRD